MVNFDGLPSHPVQELALDVAEQVLDCAADQRQRLALLLDTLLCSLLVRPNGLSEAVMEFAGQVEVRVGLVTSTCLKVGSPGGASRCVGCCSPLGVARMAALLLRLAARTFSPPSGVAR